MSFYGYQWYEIVITVETAAILGLLPWVIWPNHNLFARKKEDSS